MQAGVSVYQPINANLNARSCRTISEGVDPFAIRLGFFNPHIASVAHAQHVSSEIRDSLDSGKAPWRVRSRPATRAARRSAYVATGFLGAANAELERVHDDVPLPPGDNVTRTR